MTRDPVDEFCRTARISPDEAPAAFDDLDPDEVTRVTQLLQAALDRRHDEIATSIDEGMSMVPRPLRGTVKKALGV